MYPACTTYRLACTSGDYRACHAFMKQEARHPLARLDQVPTEMHPGMRMQFPTIVAWRAGTVIGCMGTQISAQYGIVAHPLHVAYTLRNHVPVVIRLIDAYDTIMGRAQVTAYTVLSPAWKPSGRRLWEEFHNAVLVGTYPVTTDRVYHLYTVQVPVWQGSSVA